MNLKQKQLGHFAKVKYSEIEFPDNSTTSESRVAIGWLIKNGYAVMDGYAINEVLKLIRSLRELRVEFTLKTIDTAYSKDNSIFYYEFTLAYFEDDRDEVFSAKTSNKTDPDRNPPDVAKGKRYG